MRQGYRICSNLHQRASGSLKRSQWSTQIETVWLFITVWGEDRSWLQWTSSKFKCFWTLISAVHLKNFDRSVSVVRTSVHQKVSQYISRLFNISDNFSICQWIPVIIRRKDSKFKCYCVCLEWNWTIVCDSPDIIW